MANLDALFESKAMNKLVELGTKMQGSPAVGAISSGMMGTMGLILAGSVFSIISSLLSLAGVLQATDAVYQWLQMPYNMTMGIMSIAVAFGVAYTYTTNLKMKGAVANGFVAMFLFLMVCSPVKSVELADGSSMSVMDTTYLGGTGMFTAMFVSIIVVRIIKLCADKHIVISMPDAVPQFLADSFSALIPLVINIVLWCGLNTVLQNAIGAPVPGAVMGILSVPLGALISTPGMIVLVLIAMIFWSFGIHGTGIVYIVLMAPFIAAYQTNTELVAAGQDPVFNAAFLFAGAACCGGTGNVLPLAVCCLRAKSQQLKTIGKAGLVPAIFNISEPMCFGVPIMYNPVIAIPFILNTALTTIVVALGFVSGFFRPPHVLIMTALPIGVNEFLSSMALQNLLIPVVGFVVGYLCYAPFVKMYDKQCLAKEAEGSTEM